MQSCSTQRCWSEATPTLTHWAFVMKINHRNRQPFRPRLQGTFPQKTAAVPASEGVRQCPVYWWSCNYLLKREKRNFVTFQDVWWVSISITTHHNSIHMVINCHGFRLTGGTPGKHRRHHHDVYRHASLGAAAPAFCVNYTAVWQTCFALCK